MLFTRQSCADQRGLLHLLSLLFKIKVKTRVSTSDAHPDFFVPVTGKDSEIPSASMGPELFDAWSVKFKVDFRLT